jgi:hypothetical protein
MGPVAVEVIDGALLRCQGDGAVLCLVVRQDLRQEGEMCDGTLGRGPNVMRRPMTKTLLLSSTYINDPTSTSLKAWPSATSCCPGRLLQLASKPVAGRVLTSLRRSGHLNFAGTM